MTPCKPEIILLIPDLDNTSVGNKKHSEAPETPEPFFMHATFEGRCRPYSMRYLILLLLISSTSYGQMKYFSGKQLDKFLKVQMKSLGMPGLSIAVVRKGKIVYHRALGVTNLTTPVKVDELSIFEAASLSKPVFAYLALKMADKGLLDLDKPLYQYLPFPELEYDQRYKLITARMVLDHTTGFPNWRWFDLADSARKIKRGDMYIKKDPGTFTYSGEGYHYLAKVLAHLNKIPLNTLDSVFRQEVAVPLGMQYAWFTYNDFTGQHKVTGHKNGKVEGRRWPMSFPDEDSTSFGAAGKLHTEAVSYAHFLIGLMKDETHEEMFKAQTSVPDDDNEGVVAWGLGLAIRPTKYGIAYEHGGNNGNFQSGCLFYKEKKNGYVFFTNCNKGDVFNERLRVFLEIL